MLRIATFNVENLFGRAKILNKDDWTQGQSIIKKIADFQDLLEEHNYTANRKQKIITQYQQLKEYISVREDREKLFNRKKDIVLASGKDDWDGTVEFKRDKFSNKSRSNTAKVITEIKPHILGLIEVESLPILNDFYKQRVHSKWKMPFSMLIDNLNDRRGIDVAMLSKYELGRVKTHIHDKKSNGRAVFSRDCLEVEVKLPAGESVFLLINHFLSKSGGPSGDTRRKDQVKAMIKILEEYDLRNQNVVVMGDFNDTPDSDPMSPLKSVNNLHDVLKLEFGSDMNKRWTYHFRSKEQIDYLLVSTPLKNKFKQAGVERRGMFKLNKVTNGAEKRWPSITSNSNASSDHAAVWADFDI